MSAIKIFGLKICFSTFLLLIFFSCDEKTDETPVLIPEKNRIAFISISYIGGGNYKIIKITKNSLHAEQGTTVTKVHHEKNLSISSTEWKQLITPIDPKTLDKIKSSPSTQSVDKPDETIIIKTPKKSYIYVNSYIDTLHYKQFQEFKDQLKRILPKEYQ